MALASQLMPGNEQKLEAATGAVRASGGPGMSPIPSPQATLNHVGSQQGPTETWGPAPLRPLPGPLWR